MNATRPGRIGLSSNSEHDQNRTDHSHDDVTDETGHGDSEWQAATSAGQVQNDTRLPSW